MMEGNFRGISLSYKNTPLSIRERLSLDESEIKALLLKFKEVLGISEALIVSTCNRTEVYYLGEEVLTEELIKFICLTKNLSYQDDLRDSFQELCDTDAAVQHLFRVSMGLESQVVGDIQISNQVKRAYQWTADSEMAGPFLHRLMHTIFFTNKRVVQETAFRDGAASASYAAVEMSENMVQEIENPKVLVLGVGEIGSDVIKNLVDSNIQSVTITNRTFDKAKKIADSCGFDVIPFENALDAVADADVIISTISMPTPFFTKEKIQALQLHSFKCFIDLAVPRSVEKEIEEIPGALVYNIDDIQAKTSKTLAKRLDAIPSVESIISEAKLEFQKWSQEMVFSPTIQKLKEALNQIRQEEIKKNMKKMTESELKMVEVVTKGMMNKIIKLPVLQLKAACKRGEAETLVDVLRDLFDLDTTHSKKQS